MQCPACSCDNPASANFCTSCGRRLSVSAADPASAVADDEKLARLERYLPQGITEKILRHKDKLEGERRQVTVMFCDMQGYTRLVDRLATEEAYQVMDKVYEVLIHGVHEFGGTVNEMTGDGIVGLFGAPAAAAPAAKTDRRRPQFRQKLAPAGLSHRQAGHCIQKSPVKRRPDQLQPHRPTVSNLLVARKRII